MEGHSSCGGGEGKTLAGIALLFIICPAVGPPLNHGLLSAGSLSYTKPRKVIAMTNETLTPLELLQAAGRQLQAEFREIRESNPHAGDSGAEAEEILKQFLRDRLPRRFAIESGIVLGGQGQVSRQTDLIIYDAMSAPVYRKGPRTHIVPRDNVAAVIEVKSKLSKEQLADAIDKIARIKRMLASPISNADEPVTMGPMVNSATWGCVFAYDAYTRIETLAENLRELNESLPSREWTDFVIVLGQGTISYAVQLPFSQKFAYFGGQTSETIPGFPIYLHEVVDLNRELDLNRFFLRLMSHLAFFRRRTTIDFQGLLGSDPGQAMTIQGYQYKIDGSAVPVEASHLAESFVTPTLRYWLYERATKQFIGQLCRWSWQDGAVLTYSGRVNPSAIFAPLLTRLGHQKALFMPAGTEAQMWLTHVLPISGDKFASATKHLGDHHFAVPADSDNMPMPVYKGKSPPRR